MPNMTSQLHHSHIVENTTIILKIEFSSALSQIVTFSAKLRLTVIGSFFETFFFFNLENSSTQK